MEKKETTLHNLAKLAVQKMIHQEAYGWPPICYGANYQPHRPDKPLDSPSDKPNT